MPLSAPSYTQEAGRDDTVFGAIDVTFDPTCKAPRQAIIFVTLDAPAPTEPTSDEGFVAVGIFRKKNRAPEGAEPSAST